MHKSYNQQSQVCIVAQKTLFLSHLYISAQFLLVYLEQDILSSALRTGSSQEDPSRNYWKIFDWDVKNQNKK